jgi:universal stress protein A
MTIRRILVPVDYSDCSAKALAFAVGFAAKTGASLEVVHAWDRPSYVSESIQVRQQTGETRSLIDMMRENVETEMRDFLAGVALPTRVELTHRFLAGDPASKILEELRQGQHQLVVIGTHGRTGLSHFLLGSVAEKLVRLSPVPVLTVPRGS